MESKASSENIENQKFELIRLRIRNKYYDRDDVLRKVIQEIYDHKFKAKSGYFS